MPIRVTTLPRHIFDELQRLKLILFGVMGDDQAFNRRLADDHETAKAKALTDLRKLVAKHLPSGANPDEFVSYSGENPAEANAEYSTYLERTLAEMTLCRAVDCYHWYLRHVVLLILDHYPSLVRRWATELKIKDENKIAAFERGEGRDKLMIEWFRGKEWKTRELVHHHCRCRLGKTLEYSLRCATASCINSVKMQMARCSRCSPQTHSQICRSQQLELLSDSEARTPQLASSLAMSQSSTSVS